jgi:intron-binding protein aquarius
MLTGNAARFQLLEFSGYLENYLWHFYSANATFEHILSIILMVNEKCKSGLTSALDELAKDSVKCSSFFNALVDTILSKNENLSDFIMEQYILFLINVFRSMENPVLRQSALRYVSLPLWENLSQTRLTAELSANEQLAKNWTSFRAQKVRLEKSVSNASSSSSAKPSAASKAAKSSKKRKSEVEDAAAPNEVKEQGNEEQVQLDAIRRDSTWFAQLLDSFIGCICAPCSAAMPRAKVRYIERFAELLIDLLSQLPTRRFLKVLLEDMHFMMVCRRSTVLTSASALKKEDSDLFQKLLISIDSYIHFEVDDMTGEAITAQALLEKNNAKIHYLQQVAFSDYNEVLKDLVFCSVGELSKKQHLLRHIQLLDQPQLLQLAQKLSIVTDKDMDILAQGAAAARNAVLDLGDERVLWDLITDSLVPRASQLEDLNMTPLYPTEALLWDRDKLPLSNHYSGNEVLALPKLNLQFLSIHDYLLRNFTLFRLESAYEIRDDLADAVKRMGPKEGLRGTVSFGGWARMALPISSVSIDEVRAGCVCRVCMFLFCLERLWWCKTW